MGDPGGGGAARVVVSTASEGASLGRDFLAVSALTLGSRLTGFVRIAVFARSFGGGDVADAFTAALILTDLLYRFLAEGLLAGPAMPVFVRRRDDAAGLASAHATLFRAVLLGALPVMGLLWGGARWVGPGLLPGFSPAKQELMAWLWCLLVPYLVFALIAGLMTAFLNARGWFGLPAVGPILVNLVTIGGILGSDPDAVERVAVAVVLGSVVQAVWLAVLVTRAGPPGEALWWREFDWRAFDEFRVAFMPIAGWVLLTPVVPLVERHLLSRGPVGTVAALDYTDKLVSLPTGLVGISLASAVYPRLARLADGGEPGRVPAVLTAVATLLGLGLIAPLAILSGEAAAVVETVLQRGAFDRVATAATASLLAGYAWSVLPASLVMLLNRGHFALGRAKHAFGVGVFALAVQVAGDLWAVNLFGAAVVGWVATAARWVQVALLLVTIEPAGLACRATAWGRRVLPVAVAGMAVAWVGSDRLLPAFAAVGFSTLTGLAASTVAIGVAVAGVGAPLIRRCLAELRAA